MERKSEETFVIRITSVGFAVLAMAVFKPFGLDTLGWAAYAHLLIIWVLGTIVCYITEAILKYLLRMPSSLDEGVDYIIRRNLWFQFINTPLCALMVCAYLQLAIGRWVDRDPWTWPGYFQTLAILAFCSFAIGLYWRFKFRSRFLAAELEEVRLLNEQLRMVQIAADSVEPSSEVMLSGTTSESVTLNVHDLLYAESVGNYVKVCYLREGKVCSDMLRATSVQTQESLKAYPMVVRCHRAFLVNLVQVERFVPNEGNMQLVLRNCDDRIPVSRSHAAEVKENLKKIIR
ncbi:MAG: LytTR family transcriptional regulator [Bacteroidales bacterium]|nr:LytTR family transcriptional regulator [Bacteroidales bacterium]